MHKVMPSIEPTEKQRTSVLENIKWRIVY